jgi:hypothetical protein
MKLLFVVVDVLFSMFLGSRDGADWVQWVANLLLAGVGIAGVAFGYVTLRKIADQTDAIKKGTEFQETAMRQWVKVENLRAHGSERTFSYGVPHYQSLVFAFDVVNPTKMPLTFEWLIVRVNEQRYAMTFHHFLPPDDKYPVKILVAIRDKQVEEYGVNRLVLSFIATMGYTDAFRKPQRQPFGAMCLCGEESMCRVSPYEGTLPDDKSEKQEENPNYSLPS